jgi:hypothetical protein
LAEPGAEVLGLLQVGPTPFSSVLMPTAPKFLTERTFSWPVAHPFQSIASIQPSLGLASPQAPPFLVVPHQRPWRILFLAFHACKNVLSPDTFLPQIGVFHRRPFFPPKSTRKNALANRKRIF